MAKKRKWAENLQIFVTAKNQFSKCSRNAKTKTREMQILAAQEFWGQFWVGRLAVSSGFHEALIGNRAEGRSGQLRQNVTKLQIIGRDLVEHKKI